MRRRRLRPSEEEAEKKIEMIGQAVFALLVQPRKGKGVERGGGGGGEGGNLSGLEREGGGLGGRGKDHFVSSPSSASPSFGSPATSSGGEE